MKIKRAAISLLVGASILLLSASATVAQEASPTPSPSASPSSSPDTSPSPTPSASPSSSPSTSSSPSPTPEGGTTKEEVLGESTTLGETSSGKEIAKWVIAALATATALYLTVKTVRTKAEE